MVRHFIEFSILAVVLTAATSSGQDRPLASDAVHLDATKPTIYITSAETKAVNGDFILTIHNNSTFDLSFCAWGSVADSPTTYPCYSVESNGYLAKRKGKWVWVGGPHVPDLGPRPDIIYDYTLRTGKSVNFQVPPGLLVKGLRVVLSFRYPWERPSSDFKGHIDGEPAHKISYEKAE